MNPDWFVDPEAIKRLPPAQRREAERQLAELEGLRRRDPLQFWRPHPKQHAILISDDPVRAFFGGNRSGKTTVGVVDDLIQAMPRERVPDHLLPYKRYEPPFYCRILSPDFTATMEGVIFQKIRDLAPRDVLHGNSWDRAFDKANRVLRFKNGSWFQFMTYEQDLDKFGGAALHRVHYDEEPPQNIRSECLIRLIDFAGEELFTMTPLIGMSWTYWGVYKRRGEAGYLVVEVDMDDNPHLDQATKLRVLEGLTPEERAARKCGRFVHFAGMIYPEFDREMHVIPSWQGRQLKANFVYVGIDPGQRHAAAAVFVDIAPDEALTVFDEIKLQGVTVGEMAAEIGRRCARWECEPRMFIIDPAARNLAHQTGRSDQMEYADHGIVTVPGQNAVRPGINRVKERLIASPPKLVVTEDCPQLLEEIAHYRWATPLKSANDPQEKPVKTNDHLLDALRYVVMSRPYAPREHTPKGAESIYTRLIREDRERLRRGARVGIAQGGPGRFS